MALVAPDGKWVQVNRSLCEIVGLAEAELLATDFQAITHPDDLDADLDSVKKMLAGEIQTYQMEKRYLHRQGHAVWATLSVSYSGVKNTVAASISKIMELLIMRFFRFLEIGFGLITFVNFQIKC